MCVSKTRVIRLYQFLVAFLKMNSNDLGYRLDMICGVPLLKI